jgi:hypothetical protein
MKLIVFLILTQLCFSQIIVNPRRALVINPVAGGAPAEEMEVTRWKTDLSLADSQVTNVNNFVAMLKDSLVIDSLAQMFDVMYVMANQTKTSALKNLVNRVDDLDGVQTNPGGANDTLDFVPFEGYLGYANGTQEAYINTNFNPSTDGVNFTLNDASFGFYIREGTQGETYNIAGCSDGSNVIICNPRRPNDFIITKFNDNTTVETDTTQNPLGLWIMNRTGASAYTILKNNTTIVTATTTTTALPNVELFLFRHNINGTPQANVALRQLSFFFMGESFDATEVRKINNCIESYMDSIGAGIQ